MALKKVDLGAEYFPSPIIGRPLASADIYVGEPGTDPKTVGNQKQISVLQEDGTVLPISQPISTGAGGVPVYSGEYVTILVEHPYSLRVDNSRGSQIYYVPTSKDSTSDELVYLSEYGGSFVDAIGDIGATETTLIVDTDPDELTADLTSPSNVIINWRYPFVLSVATTKTFTIYSPEHIKAGHRQQIFNGLGSVVFTTGGKVFADWFENNVTQGTTDMTNAIEAAYAALQNSNTAGTIQLLDGSYGVADMSFAKNDNQEGITIRGSQATQFVPAAGHTAAAYLITLAGTHASATQWITLDNFHLEGGGARAKGIYIGPSNNCRLIDITILDFDGTGLETQRAYDLYCTRVRVKSCGSYANTEYAVKHGEETGGKWGNAIYWDTCVVEGGAYGQLSLNGVINFQAIGGKIHGVALADTDPEESLKLLYVDGASALTCFTSVLFTHCHYDDAIHIVDDETTGVNDDSSLMLTGCSFLQMEADVGETVNVILFNCGDSESNLSVGLCTFEKEGTGLGTNGEYIEIASTVNDAGVTIGPNYFEESDESIRFLDNRTGDDYIQSHWFPEILTETLLLGTIQNGEPLIIAGGVVTASKSFIKLDSQGEVGDDDLDTINGIRMGQLLVVRSTNNGRDITLKNGTGNLNIGTDIILESVDSAALFLGNDNIGSLKCIGYWRNTKETYTITNATEDRTFDANAAAGAITNPPSQGEVENIRDSVLEIADIVGTLINDLADAGLVVSA